MTTLTVPPRSIHNADLKDLVAVLQQQQRQSADIVMPVSELSMNFGNIVVPEGHSLQINHKAGVDDTGVTPAWSETTDLGGAYRPTAQADSQIGTLLGIPTRYVRRMRESNVDLLDNNVNTWAQTWDDWNLDKDADKKVLVRMLYGSDPNHPLTAGIVRAVLSDRYGIRDNLDTVLAALDGMRAAGLGANNVRGADLSDDRLYLRVEAPELAIAQPDWMTMYRSPFQGSGHGGETAERPKLVHCGILIRNSETGNGAFSIVPELRFQVCDNGAQCNWDAVKKVHLGAKLDEGQIQWSQDTRRAAKDLMREQVKDAVEAFMSPDYMTKALDKIGEEAGIKISDAADTIKVLGKQLSYTDGETALLLDHFIQGGLLTSGGVLHAVTSAAQVIEDVDRSNEFAGTGFDAMVAAGKIARSR